MANTFVCFQVLSVINLTTGFSMITIQQDDFVEVLEYDQKHISFEADSSPCQTGHLVKISGIINLHQIGYPVIALGKVTKSIPLSSNKVKVTIELRSYDQQLWERFTSVLRQRQEELDNLLSVMREAP